MDRRHFVAGSAAAAAALTVRPSFAQDAYPSHAITFINPFPPGGAADVVGRPLAAVLEPMIKQPVRDRDQGRRRRRRSAHRSPPMPSRTATRCSFTSPSISGFAEVDKLFGRTPKFTRADFIPIARLTAGPMVLVVNDQQPYKTLKELVDDAKKRPDKLIFSSSGLYGALHLADRAVHEGRRHQDAASADQWRRTGIDGDPRQQRAGAGVLDRRRQRAR